MDDLLMNILNPDTGIVVMSHSDLDPAAEEVDDMSKIFDEMREGLSSVREVIQSLQSKYAFNSILNLISFCI